MKYLVALTAVVFLASCGANKTETTITTGTLTSTGEVNQEIEQELETLSGTIIENNEDGASLDKIEKIETSYTSPGGKVDMKISYSVDSEGKISSLNIDSNYSHQGFNEKVEQELVGKTIDDAKNLYISGASLASESFSKAMKENA